MRCNSEIKFFKLRGSLEWLYVNIHSYYNVRITPNRVPSRGSQALAIIIMHSPKLGDLGAGKFMSAETTCGGIHNQKDY